MKIQVLLHENRIGSFMDQDPNEIIKIGACKKIRILSDPDLYPQHCLHYASQSCVLCERNKRLRKTFLFCKLCKVSIYYVHYMYFVASWQPQCTKYQKHRNATLSIMILHIIAVSILKISSTLCNKFFCYSCNLTYHIPDPSIAY